MPGLGDEFRAARESRHLSLSDVSEQIHIRSVYLQSIENEEWSVIAAPVYVRGFIRTYARFLGLDPERAVEQFNTSIGALAARPHEPVPMGSIDRRRRPSPWLFIAGAVALLLVAFVGVRYFQFQQEGSDANTVASSSAAPTVAASGAASQAPAVVAKRPATAPKHGAVAAKELPLKRTLEISVTAPSWLFVKVDGAQVLQGIMPAGTRKSYHGASAFVRAGNAGGVDLTLNGKHLGAMGRSGAVIERDLTLASAVRDR